MVNWFLVTLVFVGGAITLNRFFWLVIGLETLLAFAVYRSRLMPQWSMPARIVFFTTLVAVVAALSFAAAVKRFGLDPARVEEATATLTNNIRVPIRRFAVARIIDKPFTGGGFGRAALRNEVRSKFGNPRVWHAHNIVLNYGLSMRIWGVAMAFALFGLVYRRLYRVARSSFCELKPYALTATVLVIGLFTKLMLDDFFYRQTTLFHWAVTGMVLGAYGRARRVQASGTPQRA